MMPFSTHLLSTTRNHRNSSSNNITSSSRLVQHLLLSSCLLLLISGSSSQARLLNRRDLPLSMDKEMFPLFTFQAQDFDEEAPICMAEREPCGFYSFSLDGKAPLKWIKSWCRCTAKQECVYERTDMRMRVYRQTCVPKEVDEVEEEAISEEQQQQQQHERSLTSSASQPVEFQQQPTAAEEDQQQLRDLDSSSLAAPVSSRHHHHHHHHHHNRHIRKANRRIIRRLRAILVD